jgi:hypothetical protein
MRAIVNPYFEFQNGQVFVTYVNNSEVLTSDASNTALRASLRAVPKGVPLDINAIPTGAFWSHDRDLEEALAIICGCSVSIRPLDCQRLRVFGRCNNLFGGAGNGSVTITYDQDGPPIDPSTLVQENVSGNYEFVVDIGFRKSGYISVSVDPECITGGVNTALFHYDADTYAACDEGERSKFEDITQGNESMAVETSFYENFLAYYHKADIRGYTWSGSDWQNKRAELDVRIDANRKSVVCQLLDSKYDDKDCNNCKHKAVRVSWTNPVAHCDGDVVGTYRKNKSGVTLNHTQIVDFICCE